MTADDGDMSVSETHVTFPSLDGLRLTGTLLTCSDVRSAPVVLVHGGGVTREEGGFFSRLAAGLVQAGLPNLRFDLRAHGDSEGRMEELTLSGVVNDIRAASDYLLAAVGGEQVSVIGASFGGGLSAFFAARYPERVRQVALINPLLNYKDRFIDQKPHWHDDRLDDEAAKRLTSDGFLAHSATVRHGRAMLNEVFYVQPHRELGSVKAPALIIHGTADTFISVNSSRAAVGRFGGGAELVEVEGMQHGVAMPDDPQYQHPQTQKWQAAAIDRLAGWLSSGDGR